MNAEDIASKEFPVVLRGYLREEVQAFLAGVATQIADRDTRIAGLEAELVRAREQSSTPPRAVALDRSALLRHLGEEAASILACADASAERMKAQAGITAERVRSDLQTIGSSLTDVHQLLGELVSLVQGLTDDSVLVPSAGPSVEDGAPAGHEVRTVIGEVLGLDGGETHEIQLPEEAPAQGRSTPLP